MTEQFKNLAVTTLAEALDDSETGVDVTDGSVFPASGDFRVVVDSEIMLCTSRSGNTLTVTRGAESTTAAAHDNGTDIAQVLTAASLTLAITQTKLDDLSAPDDNTDLNASSSRHGLLLKLENSGSKYLRDDGTWQSVAGGSGGTVQGTDHDYDIQLADEGVVAGNARGEYAIDLQSLRSIGTQVASGTSAVAIGVYNVSAGTAAVAIGNWNTAPWTADHAIGYGNTIGSSYADAIGTSNTILEGSSRSVALGYANLVDPYHSDSLVVGTNGRTRAPGAFTFGFQDFQASTDTVPRYQSHTFHWKGYHDAVVHGQYGLPLSLSAVDSESSEVINVVDGATFYGRLSVLAIDAETMDINSWEYAVILQNVGGTTWSRLSDVQDMTVYYGQYETAPPNILDESSAIFPTIFFGDGLRLYFLTNSPYGYFNVMARYDCVEIVIEVPAGGSSGSS